jgi:N-acetyl-gamma-glutamyl-phosphate reductase
MTMRPAVVGATGYSGSELTQILLRHPKVAKPVLFRREKASEGPADLADVFPQVSGNGPLPLEPFSISALRKKGINLLFLATPHEFSRRLVPQLLQEDVRVVDLSGAWRLREVDHRAVYGFEDADPASADHAMQGAVYGLPELWCKEIAGASLVANPGCYATSVILALAPLVQAEIIDRDHGIIADSKSGVSGAGKEPTGRTHFVSVADNLSAYSLFRHRHVGEMNEQLGLAPNELTFTPHLLPIPRGILSTIYVTLVRPVASSEIEACYRGFYASRRWVRIFAPPRLPEIQHSLHTNFCDIGFRLADDGRRLIVVSCLDNLLKGAAGQAVQNMNVMCGWNEAEGLQ